jgi:hypothetical protein
MRWRALKLASRRLLVGVGRVMVNVHLDAHAVLDVDEQIATGLAVQRLDEREGGLADAGGIDKRECQRAGGDADLLDCFGAVAAPDFGEAGVGGAPADGPAPWQRARSFP